MSQRVGLLTAAALLVASTGSSIGHATSAPEGALAGGPPPPLELIGGVRYVHVTDGGNTSGIFTDLSHPLLNGNPNAIALVTQVWNPLEMSGVYNDHPIGLDYESGTWAIYNEDLASMPLGVGFHILILPDGPTATVHTSDKTNTSGNYTDYAYSPLNAEPAARIFVTHNNRDDSKAEVVPLPLGIWFNDGEGAWSIFLEGKALMGLGLDFNLAFGPDGTNQYLHTAAKGNIVNNQTLLDHPDLNGNPRAWVLVTHNYSPAVASLGGGGGGGVFFPANAGVYYNEIESKWGIFDQAGPKGGTMPVGAAFNVLVDPHPSVYVDDFENGGLSNWSDSSP